MFSFWKTHPVLKIVDGALNDLPAPANLSSWWNFGSLLGFCLVTQILTGLFLAMQYTGGVVAAFDSINYIGREAFSGWLIRMTHANGASFFFFCLYFHIGRGMYYGSFRFHMTWGVGVLLLFATMGAAFFGYVLPWGQMSFWGASVITNLLSAIPYLGEDAVLWLWGGFSVDNATLTRFFAFHFLVPFVVAGLAALHLLFLHQTGSNNPLGLKADIDKVPFNPYFVYKDLVGAGVMFFLMFLLVAQSPWFLGDPENFIAANPLITPVHIQPEWYFLFAYAILRSVPNKLGGVIGLVMSIVVLLFLPFMPVSKFQSSAFYPLSKALFWYLVSLVLLLTWIGARPVEEPYVVTGQLVTLFYFSYYLVASYMKLWWDKLLEL